MKIITIIILFLITIKYSPYTQKRWVGKKIYDVLEGNWLFKMCKNVKYLVVQSIFQNFQFELVKYINTVAFSYQTKSNDYSFVIQKKTEIVSEGIIASQFETLKYPVTFIGDKFKNAWIFFGKNNKKASSFVIDTIEVKEHKKRILILTF